ncbi:MAG TPA: formylglycine-generating enzyme family protein [Rubrivivax sp.]|nr:formylglycine-generating enzyme family protein [Rubrivivax sp.]
MYQTYVEQAPRLRLAADLAELAAGGSVEPVRGVDEGPLLQALQILNSGAALEVDEVAVVQRGSDLWLHRLAATGGKAASLRGVHLASGAVRGRSAVLTVGSKQRSLDLSGPQVWLAATTAVQSSEPLRLRWPGGTLTVRRVQSAGDVAGRKQAAARPSGVTASPDAAQAESLHLAFGADATGAYCTLELDPGRAELAPRFRYIEPGTFLMGSTPDERSRLEDARWRDWAEQTESPHHEVRLTRGYWLADTPCTQWQWEAVTGGRPSQFKDVEDWERRPVESVSWDRVQGFLEVLRRRLPKNWEVDLPTEAQWEYAARAGTRTAYWWGNGAAEDRGNWNCEQGETTPVGRYGANPWGLFDVHGNVWEWCKGSRRLYGTRTEVDPADAGDEDRRAQRGGAWDCEASRARAAYRRGVPHGGIWHAFGFRLLLRSVTARG